MDSVMRTLSLVAMAVGACASASRYRARAIADVLRMEALGQDPIELQGGPAYIDDTTAYCYRVGVETDWNDTVMLDKNYEESVSRVTVDIPNTQKWCWGNISSPPPEWLCNSSAGPPPANASSACPDGVEYGCVRGYDLLLTPPGATCYTQRVLYVHGGSWEEGSPWSQSYPVHTSKIAKETGAIVLSIDYPLVGGWASPLSEHKYVGDAAGMLEYATNAWEWLASHGPDGKKCNCFTQRPPMFIAGDSSGGGTALALLMDLRRREREGSLGNLRFPSGAFFESPWTNLACNTSTYYSNNFAAYPNKTFASTNPRFGSLTGDVMFNNAGDDDQNSVGNPWNQTITFAVNALNYCGCDLDEYATVVPKTCPGSCSDSNASQDQLTNPIFSPYWASEDMLRGLPPLYFATSASELLAGDTSVFAEKAAKVGVIVRAELFYGMWHTFPQYSEGCREDSPYPLWQGVTALRHYGDFVHEVTKASKKCPSKLRNSDGGNWIPAKPSSMAVNNLHGLAGENATGPLIPIPPLDLDICGDGAWWPRGGTGADRDVALVAAAATGRKTRRHLRSLRLAPQDPMQGGDEASAMLQMSVVEEISEAAAWEESGSAYNEEHSEEL